MKEFRLLRADEIDVRISQVGSWGVQLLLYKDARADMTILDETVGPMNWQRRHVRDNANCIVSIWDEDKRQWIQKEDTDTPRLPKDLRQTRLKGHAWLGEWVESYTQLRRFLLRPQI